MTNERRRELKELVMSLMGVGIKTDDCYGLEECIDKAYVSDKYKWHDLRKNPEDLPIPFTRVLIYCICDKLYDSERIYTTTFYSDNSANFLVSNRVVKEIIAWRYIEPFEEDKE